MTQTVPLVRASTLVPFLKWAQTQRHGVEPLLRLSRLPSGLIDTPERLLPLASVVQCGTAMMQTEGPDIGCRVVSDASIHDLAMLGHVVLTTRTPRQAYERLMAFFPRHSTHESFSVASEGDALVLRHTVLAPLTAVERHGVQQYVAALMRSVLGLTGWGDARVRRILLTPHPKFGVEHLQPHLDGVVAATGGNCLTMVIPNEVADRRLVYPMLQRAQASEEWGIARGEGTLAASILQILPGLMEHGRPSLQDIAGLAYSSVRTLQRRLTGEGTSVAQLIDAMRCEMALARIASGGDSIGDIAVAVGYSDQSSLSRAVRRWTSDSPRSLRVRSEAAGR